MSENRTECPLCRTGTYQDFGYIGSGVCDHCGVEWTYDECDTMTEKSMRELWSKVRRWIPVSESLPGLCEMVLVWSNSSGIHLAYVDGRRQWRDADDNPGKKITHWMPLPKPPSA